MAEGTGRGEVSDPLRCIIDAAVNPTPSAHAQTNHGADGAGPRCIKEAAVRLCRPTERPRDKDKDLGDVMRKASVT